MNGAFKKEGSFSCTFKMTQEEHCFLRYHKTQRSTERSSLQLLSRKEVNRRQLLATEASGFF